MATKGPYKGQASTRPPQGGGGVTQPEQGRQVQIGAVLDRYKKQLADEQQARFIAEAALEQADAEIAALQARIAELEGAGELQDA